MPDRVEISFRRAALSLIPEGAAVVAAVSGGADSVALLHLLHRLSGRRRLRLTVGHLDHATRRGSAADRRFVERLSESLSLRCIADRRPVEELRRKDESPEEAARRVRRAFLLEVGRKVAADRIATGHTLDDQAETVLMRLVRGAGPTALAGMAASGPGPFVRPLLGLERSHVRAFLDRRGIAFREDPSNRDLRFDRNRVRRLILPILTETLNPRAASHLVEAAARLREDSEYLDELARGALSRLTRRGRSKAMTFRANDLAALPPPLARRVVRRALEEMGTDPRRIASRHIEAVLRLTSGEGGKKLELPGGRTAALLKGSVVLK